MYKPRIDILSLVSAITEIPIYQIKSSGSKNPIPFTRFLTAYMMWKYLPEARVVGIGSVLNKHHSNITYGIKKIKDFIKYKNMYKYENQYIDIIDDILTKLVSGKNIDLSMFNEQQKENIQQVLKDYNSKPINNYFVKIKTEQLKGMQTRPKLDYVY